MHLVLRQVLGAHRLEGAGADMQRDIGELHPLRAQLVEQPLVEMQAGGRRRHRARCFCIHGLVTRFVERIGGVLDIRRQRQPAVGLDQLEHIIRKLQGIKLAGPRPDRDLERVGHPDRAAGRRRLRRPHLRMHGAVVEHALDQHLDLAAGLFDAKKARLQHPRVVKHQQVATRQLRHNIGKTAVDQRVAIDLQQARRAALGQRQLRDQLGRQVKVEIAE